jgi:predicted small metal-binding protein
MINYELKCKDIGFNNCGYIASGNSESELRRKLLFHTILSHEKDFEKMDEIERAKLNDLITKILEEQSSQQFYGIK